MCGICGEIRFDGADANASAIARMMAVLAPRGPDHGDSMLMGQVGFGHRRLAIIDLSPRGNQPMHDANTGCALVFNGTIYNYRDLRRELQTHGQVFTSDSDTEVILKAYAVWGEDCVRYFTGMFAFAIWDPRSRKLFMARDRMGIKPLYYTRDRERLRFASNPQALLAAGGVATDIDPVALHHHLSLHAVVPAPRTILKSIRKVRPAYTCTIQADGRTVSRCYWQLAAQRPAEPRSDVEWTEIIHNELINAVKRRLSAADVPVGVLLSGGLDSSMLVGLLYEAGVEHLHTFSVGFEDAPEEKGSEFEYSDQVVARYQTDHKKFLVPNSEVLTRLPEAVMAMAEPMVGQDAVAFYLLSERVSKEVKVVQSGQGADEVFGGYFWYPQMAAAHGSAVERFAPYYVDRSHDEFLATVDPRLHGPDYTTGRLAHALTQDFADEFIDQVLRFDVTTLVVDDPVKRVDNMTMAWGLEARVPFLDHHLVECAAQMPSHMKLGSHGKHVLKTIARGLIPDAVIDRPKGYFPVPALKFVRGTFYEFMRDVLESQACRQRGIFQQAYVAQLLAAPERYMTPLQGSKLWHLALLEFWLQTHTDNR